MNKVYYSNELYHYGTPGMKWGVRKYQNYDGSLTQEGLERYRQAGEVYDQRKAKYKAIKKDKTASSYDKRLAKAKMKEAKREMNTRYKNLKQLKLADKGKIRYLSGERIRGNAATTNALRKIGGASLTAAGYLYYYNRKGGKVFSGKVTDSDAVNALSIIGGIAITSSIVKGYIDEIPNRELRAYYSHPTVRK